MTTEALSFDSLQLARRTRGCFVCGEKSRFAVSVQIRRLDERGQNRSGAGDVKSVSRSLCEAHAVERFMQLAETLS